MKIHRETAKQNRTYRALLNDLRMGRWQANTFPAERELAAAYAVSNALRGYKKNTGITFGYSQ
jgi:DNA-binding GntR family transcriptional regulator